MNKHVIPVLSGYVLEEQDDLSLGELCRVCGVHAEWVLMLVEQGVLEPCGGEPRRWRFSSTSPQRVRRAMRLHRDLGLDDTGLALALDLLDEIARLQGRGR